MSDYYEIPIVDLRLLRILASDYTGFDCVNSYMKLYVSRSLNRLLRKAVPNDLIKNHKEIQELYDFIHKT